MALDEPTEEDAYYEVEGITWIVSSLDAHALRRGVRVDHMDGLFGSGFYVTQSSPFGGC